jgi:hypothetical protein
MSFSLHPVRRTDDGPIGSLSVHDEAGGTMRYMMFVCADESLELDADAARAMRADSEAWVAEMDGRRVRLQGSALGPVTDATTVRVREGEVLISDGPFAEAKEQIGGFDILECAHLDEALEVAAKHPVARYGTIEVRPFREL